MAASATKLHETKILKVDNGDKSGRNLAVEYFDVVFDTDKTVELPTTLKVVYHVSAFAVHATAVSALTWGAELTKDATTGKIAFNTSANSTETWRVRVEGLA